MVQIELGKNEREVIEISIFVLALNLIGFSCTQMELLHFSQNLHFSLLEITYKTKRYKPGIVFYKYS